MLTRLTLSAIDVYKAYLSPRKGFNCAHRVLHGGESCSTYAQEAVRAHGAWGAAVHVKSRFAACKAAAHTLSEQRSDGDVPKKKRRRDSWFERCGDCACVGIDFPFCRGGKSVAADGGGCDVVPDCNCGP